MDDNTCHFTSFLTAFQSYPDDGRAVMKGCVQWDPDSIATGLLIGLYEMNRDLSRDYLRTKITFRVTVSMF